MNPQPAPITRTDTAAGVSFTARSMPAVTAARAQRVPRVTFVQSSLPHYREPFFRRLQLRLEQAGVELSVVYGQQHPGLVPESVALDERWAHRITNRFIALPGNYAVWQPCWQAVRGADLVIVEQANRLLLNYLLLAVRAARGVKVAFWGHGRNMQARRPRGMAERLKRALVSKVDWWFAYTDLSADIVGEAGFSRDRITVVQNAIDTEALAEQLARQNPGEVSALKAQLGIDSQRVGVYCGGMYEHKRLDFLLAACERIRAQVPDFHMVFVGSGPLQGQVQQAAQRHRWIHYVGAKFDAQRVPYLCMGKAMLMPGLVGLAILDSLTARLPLFTTRHAGHSPEIAYLSDGVNGMMAEDTVEVYAAAVAAYLRSESEQWRLRAGCEQSAGRYTLGAMVESFADGIEQCLRR